MHERRVLFGVIFLLLAWWGALALLAYAWQS